MTAEPPKACFKAPSTLPTCLSVIDDVLEVGFKQPGVQRVAHRADAADGIPASSTGTQAGPAGQCRTIEGLDANPCCGAAHRADASDGTRCGHMHGRQVSAGKASCPEWAESCQWTNSRPSHVNWCCRTYAATQQYPPGLQVADGVEGQRCYAVPRPVAMLQQCRLIAWLVASQARSKR